VGRLATLVLEFEALELGDVDAVAVDETVELESVTEAVIVAAEVGFVTEAVKEAGTEATEVDDTLAVLVDETVALTELGSLESGSSTLFIGTTSGAAGVNTSVTFCAAAAKIEGASTVFANSARSGGLVASPNCSSRLVMLATLSLVGVVGSIVEFAAVVVEFATEAELDGIAEEVEFVADVELLSVIPSSWALNHIGRITPVPGSYAKTWLLWASADAPFMHISTVSGEGAGGFGSNVAQKGFSIASSSSNIGICSATFTNEATSDEVEFAHVEFEGAVEFDESGSVATR